MHQIPAAPTAQSSTSAKPNPALARLHAGVTELLSSQAWQEALRFKTKFHAYSFNNALLIYLQRPDASLVAGYKRWHELGRQVRKGETGIAILAPIVRRVEDEDKKQVVGFRSAQVFDVSQTDGEPLPDVPQPVLLTDDGEAVLEALTRAEALAVARGFPVVYQELQGAALGSFSVTQRVIKVRPDLPPLQTLKTLVHELAHGLMHAAPEAGEQRHLVELEAESCAFLVLHDLELDTSRYTFPYLANWAEHPDELLGAGDKAAKVAAAVLGEIKPLVGVAEAATDG